MHYAPWALRQCVLSWYSALCVCLTSNAHAPSSGVIDNVISGLQYLSCAPSLVLVVAQQVWCRRGALRYGCWRSDARPRHVSRLPWSLSRSAPRTCRTKVAKLCDSAGPMTDAMLPSGYACLRRHVVRCSRLHTHVVDESLAIRRARGSRTRLAQWGQVRNEKACSYMERK